MHKRLIVTMPLAVLLACVAVATFSQDRLAVSSTKPTVDGVVQAGEYTYSHDFDQKMTLYASRTTDTLYFAVVAPTDGWVSVGLGSKKMDGSVIYIGYVGTDGTVSFKTQVGKGVRHVDATPDINATLISYAMKQQDGKTTLEIAVKAAAFIKQGQSSLDVIYAVGDQRSFNRYHTYRGATSLSLE
ncbi:MAG: DOMON domain-containing protein [Spirochaetia bacterium]